jgi:succinate dehydrogenase / fumarate reductase iron-sulfur subunit
LDARGGQIVEIALQVRRYNPDITDPKPFWQEYTLGDIQNSATVLDVLIRIREELDGTLTLRCSCRSAICGSCAMRINGHAALACKTKVIDATKNGGPIVVEPMGNMRPIKDLVTDMKIHWDKVRAVEPWLQNRGPEPQGEYLAPNERMLHLAGVMSCIMCGACVSDCASLEVDVNFLGPAALAKAYRFVADPRDDAAASRLAKLEKYGGIWDCTRCMQCVQVCPKGVDPMGRIMALRDRAIQMGYDDTYGARHAKAVAESVEHSGWLDELRLPIKTFGIFNIKEMLKLVPVGIRAQRVGKRPPIFHKKRPGAEQVRRIFERVDKKR